MGGVVGLCVALCLIRKDGIAARTVLPYLLCVQFIGTGLGAKLYSVFMYGWEGSAREVFLEGGWKYPGSVFGGLLVAIALRGWLPPTLSLARFLDLYAPAFAIANAIGQLACFLRGCCHGLVTGVPWAVHYPHGSIPWVNSVLSGDITLAARASAPMHPLPLYTMAMGIALAWLCLRLRKSRAYDGQVILVFLAVDGLLRSSLDFLRFEYDPLHQTPAILGLGAATALLIKSYRSREQQNGSSLKVGP